MKILVCQLNPVVGDIPGNTQKLHQILLDHAPAAADLVIFPELFLQGYPPKDLLEKKWFLNQTINAHRQIKSISEQFPDTGILFGTILPSKKAYGKPLVNAALLIANGHTLIEQEKMLLPTYDIFDETRYFEPAVSQAIVPFKGEKLGITICEDAWCRSGDSQQVCYPTDPVESAVASGATVLINMSASPFYSGKEEIRFGVMSNHAVKHRLPLIFVNQTGGNDDLVFDGNSMVLDGRGNLLLQLPPFTESIGIFDTQTPPQPFTFQPPDLVSSVHDALVCGVRDYVKKCGFTKVLLGLSGGIDSALTAVIASRAVGSENVWGVTMPSRYSSEGSVGDSQILAKNLGIRFSELPIEDTFCSFLSALDPMFSGTEPNLAEENLQARIRGTMLMALSNKYSMLLLSTGNKSEMAVGYSTLYGDMNGGLSVISDLPKEMVYKLSAYVNRNNEVIPVATISKAPSAELRPDQKDQDTLPPYPELDAILERLVERGLSIDEVASEGFTKATVVWIAQAIARNEYKRRQAPTGLKVTLKAFGSGRRFPIAAKYSWQ